MNNIDDFDQFNERIGHIDKTGMSKKEKDFDKELIKKVAKYRKDHIFDFTIEEIKHGVKYGYKTLFEHYFCDYLGVSTNKILPDEYLPILIELGLENNLKTFLEHV